MTQGKACTRLAVHIDTVKKASSCNVREQFLGTVCFMGVFFCQNGGCVWGNLFKTVSMWLHLLVPKQNVLLWA